MKQYNTTELFGLSNARAVIENTCSMSLMYRRCGLRPKHLIVPLDPGCGRTTLLEYMTDMYKNADILDFASGLDDYIEIIFDGSLPQLRQAFATIDSAAVYANEYRGIIGMDISCIASHLGELQLVEFLNNCKRVGKHACIIFYVHSVPSRNEEILLEKLSETIENIQRIVVEPYSYDEICDIIIKTLIQRGIQLNLDAAGKKLLSNIVADCQISTVSEAIATADALVNYADFSGFIPVIDETGLKTMVAGWSRDTERSEVK